MKNNDLYLLMKQHDCNRSNPNITYFYLFGWEGNITLDYISSQYDCDIEKSKEILQNLYDNNFIAKCNNGTYVPTDELKYILPINFFGFSFNDMCDNVFNIISLAYPLKIERDFIKKFVKAHRQKIICKLNGYLEKCSKYFSGKYIISVNKKSKLRITNKKNHELSKRLSGREFGDVKRFYFLGFLDNYLINIMVESLVLKSIVDTLIEEGYSYYVVPSILVHENYEKQIITTDRTVVKRLIELTPILKTLKLFKEDFFIEIFSFNVKTHLINKL